MGTLPEGSDDGPGGLVGCAIDADGVEYCTEITTRERAIERGRAAGHDVAALEITTARLRAVHLDEALARKVPRSWQSRDRFGR